MLKSPATIRERTARKNRSKHRIQVEVSDFYRQYRRLITDDHLDHGVTNSLSEYPREMIEKYLKLRRFLAIQRGIKFLHPQAIFKFIYDNMEQFVKENENGAS